MKILVLGAGVVGVTTAHRLAERGHSVTVLERQSGPALGTSRANAGLITPSQAPPWNEPGVPQQALKWLFEKEGALKIRPRLEPALWLWLLRFALHSLPQLHNANARAILALARYSCQELVRLAIDLGIDFDRTDRGVLTLMRGTAGRAGAERTLRLLQALGIECSLIDTNSCVALEPALAPIAKQIDGGLHTPEDSSGDIYKFVTAVATAAARLGVSFRYQTPVDALYCHGNRVIGIVSGRETITADSYVVALGAESRELAAAVGIRLPIYPVQGLSLTLPTAGWEHQPTMPVRDPVFRVAISPFPDRLRVAGMAILDGGNSTISPGHIAILRDAVGQVFPTAPVHEPSLEWSGLRPMTPDGPPVIGRTRYQNLYLNTGHGPLGWTLACGSAQVLTDLIDNRKVLVSLDPFRADRYSRWLPI